MKDFYAQATITPFRAAPNMSYRYKVEVDGPNPDVWANIGVYDTPEAAIASFTPPLRLDRQLEALQALRDGKAFTFSLEDLSL